MLLTFNFLKISAQSNLVPNPSFEDTTSCPPNGLGLGQLNYTAFWQNPTLGTPDYWNMNCSPITIYQYARTGSGYVGVYAYNTSQPNDREYIQVQLTDSLISNNKYCVSFYITLSQFSIYAVSTIGCYVSQNAISSGNQQYLPFSPQIENGINNLIRDTINWVLISSQFVAQGGEKFITIGNFRDDLNCGLTLLPRTGGSSSYYFIDDVSVVECEEEALSIPNVFTPNGDGINDLFEIKGLQKGDKINIYNRWGTKVFYNINEHAYWDGYTTSGEPCSSGTYFYTIDLINGERKSGYIQLIR